MRRTVIASFCTILAASAILFARGGGVQGTAANGWDNWPQWRGPQLNGVSRETGLPRSWSPAENIAWKLPTPSRTGSTARDAADWLARARVVNVDHHVSNDGSEAAVSWIDPDAAATAEMTAELVPALGVEIDTTIATVLAAGIVQDTHTFSHPNATPRTLRVMADLVAAGAPLSRLHRAIYADKPFSTLALWGQMLNGIGQRRDGRIVHAAQTLAMLAQAGSEPSATEGFVDLLASTKDGEITVLFKETDASHVRVSVRTASRADAVAITSAFGGGGHARASGCSLDVPLAEAERRVLDECERELDRADARGR